MKERGVGVGWAWGGRGVGQGGTALLTAVIA
jgi:hypothetical protein